LLWNEFHQQHVIPMPVASSTESFNLIHVSLTGKVQILLNSARRQQMFLPLPSTDGKYLAFQAITVAAHC